MNFIFHPEPKLCQSSSIPVKKISVTSSSSSLAKFNYVIQKIDSSFPSKEIISLIPNKSSITQAFLDYQYPALALQVLFQSSIPIRWENIMLLISIDTYIYPHNHRRDDNFFFLFLTSEVIFINKRFFFNSSIVGGEGI